MVQWGPIVASGIGAVGSLFGGDSGTSGYGKNAARWRMRTMNQFEEFLQGLFGQTKYTDPKSVAAQRASPLYQWLQPPDAGNAQQNLDQTARHFEGDLGRQTDAAVTAVNRDFARRGLRNPGDLDMAVQRMRFQQGQAGAEFRTQQYLSERDRSDRLKAVQSDLALALLNMAGGGAGQASSLGAIAGAVPASGGGYGAGYALGQILGGLNWGGGGGGGGAFGPNSFTVPEYLNYTAGGNLPNSPVRY